jgi:hypothetical protein
LSVPYAEETANAPRTGRPGTGKPQPETAGRVATTTRPRTGKRGRETRWAAVPAGTAPARAQAQAGGWVA